MYVFVISPLYFQDPAGSLLGGGCLIMDIVLIISNLLTSKIFRSLKFMTARFAREKQRDYKQRKNHEIFNP